MAAFIIKINIGIRIDGACTASSCKFILEKKTPNSNRDYRYPIGMSSAGSGYRILALEGPTMPDWSTEAGPCA